jgi:hypothetical protein
VGMNMCMHADVCYACVVVHTSLLVLIELQLILQCAFCFVGEFNRKYVILGTGNKIDKTDILN